MASGHVFSAYHYFLSELGVAGTPYFLEGGQAVNFWTEYFRMRGAQALDSVSPLIRIVKVPTGRENKSQDEIRGSKTRGKGNPERMGERADARTDPNETLI